MRLMSLLFLFLVACSMSGCAAYEWVAGSDEEPANDGDLRNDPNGVIPNRPTNNPGNPNREAIDANQPWRPESQPSAAAKGPKRDLGLEFLQHLSSISVKDSTMPWYNRAENTVSETVEDINMHYKRLLPPLNPGR